MSRSQAASRKPRSTGPTLPASPWARATTRRMPRDSFVFSACRRARGQLFMPSSRKEYVPCGPARRKQHRQRARLRSPAIEETSAMKMWSGRFSQGPDAEFEEWQRSFPFDRLLLPYEVAASKAHAAALAKVGVLNEDELATTLFALDQI